MTSQLCNYPAVGQTVSVGTANGYVCDMPLKSDTVSVSANTAWLIDALICLPVLAWLAWLWAPIWVDWLARCANSYRAWINAKEWHLLVAGLGLSELAIVTLINIVYSVAFGWWWLLAGTIATLPVTAFIVVAQGTQWRSEDTTTGGDI